MTDLSDVHIIDVCRGSAGPLATQLLADFGAAIIRVDQPGAVRRPSGLVRLRGRRSIAIDLSMVKGQALLEKLAATADVLIAEPGLDGLNPVRASFESLARANPRLIYCRITGYGDEGPLAHGWVHDHLVAARYGVYSQPGFRDGPTYVTAPVPSLGAGLLAVQAIGTALYLRERTGLGQAVETSLLAGALAFQPGATSVRSPQQAASALGPPNPLGGAPLYRIYQCADGRWLHFGCLTAAFQTRALRVLGLDNELAALGFGTPRGRENLDAIIEKIAARMRTKPFSDWAGLLEEADVPFAPSQWPEDLLDDPQVQHEGLLVTIDDPLAGRMEQMGPAFTVAGQVWQTPAPAPTPGEHTDEICHELGLDAAELAGLRRERVIE